MNGKVAFWCMVPALAVLVSPALARDHDKRAKDRVVHRESHDQRVPRRHVDYGRVRVGVERDRSRPNPSSLPSFTVNDSRVWGDSGRGDSGRDGDGQGNDDRRRVSDDGRYQGDDRRRDRPRNDDRRRDVRRGRRDDRYRDRDRYRPWHRERYEHSGRTYWRFNIRLFPHYDFSVWRGGYWHNGWYDGRWGWWWIVSGIWYYYPAPIYPYPNPYVPGSVVVINNQPETPAPPAEAAPQYWYYCSSPQGYYPYVPECQAGWTKVAATPSANGTTPASPPESQPPTAQAPAPPPPSQPPAPNRTSAPVQYWYHCKSPAGYYPYVKTCPGGWERVPATPPATTNRGASGGG